MESSSANGILANFTFKRMQSSRMGEYFATSPTRDARYFYFHRPRVRFTTPSHREGTFLAWKQLALINEGSRCARHRYSFPHRLDAKPALATLHPRVSRTGLCNIRSSTKDTLRCYILRLEKPLRRAANAG